MDRPLVYNLRRVGGNQLLFYSTDRGNGKQNLCKWRDGMESSLTSTDYVTYRQVAQELPLPICDAGLDSETVKKLYESKWVYLESLRSRCFIEMNRRDRRSLFSLEDYRLIVDAQKKTVFHMRELIRSSFFRKRGLDSEKLPNP